MAEEIKKERKKRSLSLIQPTSVPTLGNYLGAMRGWKDFQDDFDTVFGIADLHSITVRQDPQKLRTQTTQLYALLMATGLDPDKSILFIQSHVPQHSQLAWILNCYTQFGELNRMTQFKDKSQQHADTLMQVFLLIRRLWLPIFFFIRQMLCLSVLTKSSILKSQGILQNALTEFTAMYLPFLNLILLRLLLRL